LPSFITGGLGTGGPVFTLGVPGSTGGVTPLPPAPSALGPIGVITDGLGAGTPLALNGLGPPAGTGDIILSGRFGLVTTGFGCNTPLVLGGLTTHFVTLPPSLKAALQVWWAANGLTASVGPLYTQIAKENKPPYAVQTVIAGPKRFWNFTKSYYEWVWVQVAVFGTGEADVRQRAEAARDTLDLVMDTPSLLVMSPGTVTGCWGEEGVRTGKPPGTNVPGGATYMATMKYRFQVYRTRP
jgi:hypothetical protein